MQGLFPAVLSVCGHDFDRRYRSTRFELAEIARENGCWYHVDAAYGGPLAFSPQHKDKLRGIERADSITFDPHKWMFVPFSCGATLVRDGGRVLRDVVRHDAGVSE